MPKLDPYDGPDWFQNWAALHNLTIEEMEDGNGWMTFAADGTPHVHCFASWTMEVFLGSLVTSDSSPGIYQHVV